MIGINIESKSIEKEEVKEIIVKYKLLLNFSYPFFSRYFYCISLFLYFLLSIICFFQSNLLSLLFYLFILVYNSNKKNHKKYNFLN